MSDFSKKLEHASDHLSLFLNRWVVPPIKALLAFLVGTFIIGEAGWQIWHHFAH